MKRSIAWVLVTGLVLGSAGTACKPPPPRTIGPDRTPAAAAGRLAPDALPALDRWRQHLTEELLPFWTTPAALGTPLGNFPTFRCNDGSAFAPAAPCQELASPPGWIAPELARDYTRMKSRQTFLYGVAFHVTGDERYLGYARAGVEWLRKHAYDPQTGSAVSYWEKPPGQASAGGLGVAGPPLEQRTTQDLAYAQLGLAFYYYLTRDPEVLADLTRLEQHVMARYWDSAMGKGMLRWVISDAASGAGAGGATTSGEAARQELVAQLDQINAYMLLVTPLVEDAAAAARWRGDLLKLAQVIREQYFAPELGMFWGRLDDAKEKRLGGRHLDFGHSMKAAWMLYLAGQTLNAPELTAFAAPLVAPMLAKAAQPSGCWASRPLPGGQLERGSQWWIYAELDQAAATLASREPQAMPYAGYLKASYACWLERFVDHQHGDIWPFVPEDWNPRSFAEDPPLKAFHWKNGYHQAEHALVALITTAGLTGQPLPLYYAFVEEPEPERIQPYYFRGVIAGEREHLLPRHPNLRGKRVEFREIK